LLLDFLLAGLGDFVVAIVCFGKALQLVLLPSSVFEKKITKRKKKRKHNKIRTKKKKTKKINY